MAVRPSRESSAGGFSAAISGIGSLGQRIPLGDRNFGGGQAAGSYRACGRLHGRQDALAMLLDIQLRNFGLDLGLEFVRGTLELIQGSADLPSDFGQLLGPEQDQGKQEKEDHLWKAQVHISQDTAGANWRQWKCSFGCPVSGFETEISAGTAGILGASNNT